MDRKRNDHRRAAQVEQDRLKIRDKDEKFKMDGWMNREKEKTMW